MSTRSPNRALLDRSSSTPVVAVAGVLLLLLFPVAFSEEEAESEPPEDKSTVIVDTGYRVSSDEGSLRRVAEFEDTSDGPVLGLWYNTSPYAKTFASINLFGVDGDDAFANVEVDWNRVLKAHATFDVVPHRLDHDPLLNLNAVSEIKVTRSTDFEPDAEYRIRVRDYQAGFEFQPVRASWLTLRANYRTQERKGTVQHLNVSHCTSCHVTANGRDIDQQTRDFTVGFHAYDPVVEYDYQLLVRQFEENAPDFMAPFERAYRPANPGSVGPPPPLVLPFNDRLWYQDGDFAVSQVPDIERIAHTFKIKADLKQAGRLAATFAASETENETFGNDRSFFGGRARYSWRPKDNVKVNLSAQHDEIDAEDANVDIVANYADTSELVTGYSNSPGVPLTFQEWRALTEQNLPAGSPLGIFTTPDFSQFTRRSSLNRTDSRFDGDVWWRPLKRGSARLSYRLRFIDRDNVRLADGTGETTTHRVKLAWNQRLAKRLRWNHTFTVTQTDNPYVNVQGGLRRYLEDDLGNTVGVAGSPKSPMSLQYYQLHQLRIANLGNAATDDYRMRSYVTYAPGSDWSLNANVRYRTADNDELNLSDWERDTLGIGVNLFVAATPRFNCTLGVDHTEEETRTLVVVPVMDG